MDEKAGFPLAMPPQVHTPKPSRPRTLYTASSGTVSGYSNSSHSELAHSNSYSTLKRHSYTDWSMHKSVKYGKGKYFDVELIPQPSDDPDDPLNWRIRRKDLNLVALLVMVGLTGGMKTAFLTTSAPMAVHYNVSYTAISALTAAPLILSAFTGFASSILSRIIGKRPMYLAATLLTLIGSVWNITAENDYGSCMGARLVQGLGWGVFDTLVMGSIQDTYFEHERNLRVIIYNVFSVATTWGSPLVGGVASNNANTFTVQFRIISAFYILAIPLIALAAPETVFDRTMAACAPTPVSGFTLSRKWQPWRFRHRLSKDRVRSYLYEMRPCSFTGRITRKVVLQVPRALAAPTTIYTFLLSFIPISALWGFSSSLSLLLAPRAVSADPQEIGTLVVGPWIIATLVICSLCFYRGEHLKVTQLAHCLFIIGGSALLVIGVLSFGLGLTNFMTFAPTLPTPTFFSQDDTHQLSLPLVSFQIGIVAAAAAILDAVTRPLLARSAEFTSSSMAISVRNIGDMHTGVVIYRNLASGIFVLVIPAVISASAGGLRAIVIGLSVTQAVVAMTSLIIRRFFDQSIWRADGKVMGLVDLQSLKLSDSFFDLD